jgi:tetratricopeptide (TPR) repeat protein
MLNCMTAPILLLAVFALTLADIPAGAQDSAPALIVQADELWDGGQPKAAIAILEPVLRAGAQSFTEEERGAAWDLLGLSYHDLEIFDRARQAYGKAIEILRSIPTAQAQYAAALNNLACMEQTLGEKDSAKALSKKAEHIYEQLREPAGIAVAATNLAGIAYAQKDFKMARRSLATALQEAQATNRLNEDDFAAMYAVKSALALHDGRDEEAISSIQQTIDCWIHRHGPSYFMLATGYLLRARVFAKSGSYTRALADAQHALAIDDASIGRNSLAYLTAKTEYAQILGASGAKEEATRLKKEASSALADLESRQCNGCTIDANGFR